MTAKLVMLVNGQLVSRDAEAWRDECLARHVLALPTLTLRNAWLDDYRKLHGDAEYERLQALVLDVLAAGVPDSAQSAIDFQSGA